MHGQYGQNHLIIIYATNTIELHMAKLKISDKCYTDRPQRHQQIDLNLYVKGNDWLIKLIRLCKPATQENFEKHVGASSTYSSKPMLLNSLKFHYAILSGALKDVAPTFDLTDNQKGAVVSKINEEIQACTPGFHGRVDSLLNSYFFPKTIDELLESIRYDIVERTANSATNEVHANNRFFIMASKMGFGVHPKLPSDPHRGAIPDSNIQEQLTRAFSEQFQPFSTLRYLKELILTPFDEYVGRKETGYQEGTYGPGLEYLKVLFGEKELNYEYLIIDEATSVVYDINWNLILGKLWDLLLKKNYFDYSTWSGYFNSYWLKLLSNLSTFVLKEKHYNDAMMAVGQLFLDPSSVRQKDLEKIPYLFLSDTECFSFLNCNVGLSNSIKLSILFRTLDLMYEKKLHDIDNAFWQFAAENMELSSDFGTRFSEKYPEILSRYEQKLLRDPTLFQQWVETSSAQMLKGLILKLNYISRQSLEQILQQLNYKQQNGLMLAMSASKGRPEVMQSLVKLLINRLGQPCLITTLRQKDREGQNLLTMMLLIGKGQVDGTRALLKIIEKLPNNVKRSILQLDEKTKNNGLRLAIMHCPQVAPSILNFVLTLDHESQSKITGYCLFSTTGLHGNRACFRVLLELNQKVNALAKQPKQAIIYAATMKLQLALVTSLHDYFESGKEASAFSTLQSQWQEAIQTAIKTTSVELDKLAYWDTFFSNLALVLLSIPLLGLPLAINYYRTGCKRVFFQSTHINQLEDLDKTIQDPSFSKSILVPV